MCFLFLAVVRDYMLEKSRVVHQSKGEGTFHIFYALFAGCPKDVRNDLFLTSQTGEYRYMYLIYVFDNSTNNSFSDHDYCIIIII